MSQLPKEKSGFQKRKRKKRKTGEERKKIKNFTKVGESVSGGN